MTTASLRRVFVVTAIAAVAAVGAAGPATAAPTLAQVTDGTSNTLMVGVAQAPARPPEGIIAVLIGL
jgi:hypothetical protein